MASVFFLALWRSSCFRVLYLSSLLSIRSNSRSNTRSSVKAFEIMSWILSSFVWANNQISSCFFCFTFTAERLFHVTVVAIDKSKLAPVRAIQLVSATPEAKAAIEVDPSNYCGDNESCISGLRCCYQCCLTFFASFSRSSISCKKNASISLTFWSLYFCAVSSSGALGSVG